MAEKEALLAVVRAELGVRYLSINYGDAIGTLYEGDWHENTKGDVTRQQNMDMIDAYMSADCPSEPF